MAKNADLGKPLKVLYATRDELRKQLAGVETAISALEETGAKVANSVGRIPGPTSVLGNWIYDLLGEVGKPLTVNEIKAHFAEAQLKGIVPNDLKAISISATLAQYDGAFSKFGTKWKLGAASQD